MKYDPQTHAEHPARRVNLTAAFLLDYWGRKGAIPHYASVVDGLVDSAREIAECAVPVEGKGVGQ